MRSLLISLAGLLVGAAMQGTAAQPDREPLLLNHVAVSVPDLDEGIGYYIRALGLTEALTYRDAQGTPFAYLHISRDTFLELQPAAPGQAPGLLHIGLEVDDVERAARTFREQGLTVGEPARSARTGAVIAQATGLHGLRFELLEFPPGSAQRQAMDTWPRSTPR